jgi:hypothetical protein
MKKKSPNKYPQTVCLDCLIRSRKDTIDDFDKTGRIMGPVSEYYSTYTFKCEVCGVVKECTESMDFGNPNFNKQLQRLRLKKINKILNKV